MERTLLLGTGVPPVYRPREPRAAPYFDVVREHANTEILDEILSVGPEPMIQKFDLQIRNREIATEQDVEALVDDIRKRLLDRLASGARIRLL